MGNLLFSPTGRIGPAAFMKGMLVIGAVGAVFDLSGLVNLQLSQMLHLVSFLLIIPFFFIAIKRSHDANNSGWMSIVWFIVWAIIYLITSYIINKLMPSAAELEMKTLINLAVADGAGLRDVLSMSREFVEMYGEELGRQKSIPTAIACIVSAGVSAWLITMFNPHDPDDNEYGPAQ